MAWIQEINVAEGIVLPTHGEWINVPGSPFQVMARDSDMMGTMYVRINPAYAHHWNEFAAMMESGDQAL